MKKTNDLLMFMLIILLGSNVFGKYSVEQLLSDYEKTSLINYQKASYEIFVKQEFNGGGEVDGRNEISNITIYQRGNDTDVRSDLIYSNKKNDEKINYLSRQVIMSDTFYNFSTEKGEPVPFVSIDAQKEELPKYKKYLLGHAGLGRILCGMYYGNGEQSLVDFLRSDSDNLKIQEDAIIDGHKAVLIESKSKYGLTQIWLDQEHGFSLKKMIVKKSIGDYYGSRPLGTPPKPLPAGAKSYKPHQAIVSCELILDSVEVQNIDGMFFPVSARIKERTEYKNGEFVEELTEYKANNINFNPDFETSGAFKIDIPNGTPVYFKDARGLSGLKFEWQDDKPETLFDQSFLDVLDSEVEQIKSGQEPNLPASAKTEQQPPAANKCNVPEVNQAKQGSADKAAPPANEKQTNYTAIAVIGIIVVIVAGLTFFYKSWRKPNNA